MHYAIPLPHVYCQRTLLEASLLFLHSVKRQSIVYFYGRKNSKSLLPTDAEHFWYKQQQAFLLSLIWLWFSGNYGTAESYKGTHTGSVKRAERLYRRHFKVLSALKAGDLFKLPFLNSPKENLNILANAQEFLLVVPTTFLYNYFFCPFPSDTANAKEKKKKKPSVYQSDLSPS